MSLESFNYIDSLNASNPTTTDNVSEGDDHIRGIKTTIKNTFPNINAAVTATDEELNYVDGVTSNIQTQLGTKLPLAGGTMTGTIAGFTSTGIDDNATSTAITIDASEKVGIGTTSPAQSVQLSKNTIGGTTSLLVSNPNGSVGAAAALKLGVSPEDDTVAKFAIIHKRNAVYGRGNTHFCSNPVGDVTEVTDADAVITIEGSSGNVGIGDTTPSVPLDVAGNIRTSTGILFGTDTAAANALDDYETGDFTATLRGGTGEPATLLTATAARYTKIGRSVTFEITLENQNTTGYSGTVSFTGLPFTSTATSRKPVSVATHGGTSFVEHLSAVIPGNSTIIEVWSIRSGTSWVGASHNAGASKYIWISGTYQTT